VSAVAGIGGVGKTTLAVHVAHAARHHFPDGQLHCDLHGTDQPSVVDDVLGRFLLALGIPVDSYYDQTCYNGYGYYYDEGDLRRTADPFPVADRRFAAPPPGWQRPCDWR